MEQSVLKSRPIQNLTANQKQSEAATAGASEFEEQFSEHWAKVYQVLFQLVGDHAEAEDLALEVFWRLYRRPPARLSGGGLGGWLYRVACNLGYNSLRAARRRARYEEQAGRESLDLDLTPGPVEVAEQRERREQVRQVLGQMKAKSAKLLVLRHSGLTYQQLAEVLSVPAVSIGTLLARAEKEFLARHREQYGSSERLEVEDAPG